jgi:flagellar protein FliS
VLDMDRGGEVAENLRRLYAFMNRRLWEANTKRDPQMIQEVITLMEELNQSWKAVVG